MDRPGRGTAVHLSLVLWLEVFGEEGNDLPVCDRGGMVGVVDVLHAVLQGAYCHGPHQLVYAEDVLHPTIVDRGTAALVAAERIGEEVAAARQGSGAVEQVLDALTHKA